MVHSNLRRQYQQDVPAKSGSGIFSKKKGSTVDHSQVINSSRDLMINRANQIQQKALLEKDRVRIMRIIIIL